MDTIIYQIGRLETNAFDMMKFSYGNHTSETSLSSFAIRDSLRENGSSAEVVLIYPVSLPFNIALLNDKFREKCSPECYTALNDAIGSPSDYLKNPIEFFKLHPHSKEANDFFPIYSLGRYKVGVVEIAFNTYYNDIFLLIFLDMIMRYLKYKNSVTKIIVDISSGHNIYVTALIEALRYLTVWLQLYNWADKSPVTYTAFSEPIILRGITYKIYTEPQSIKAFFDSPVRSQDITNNKLVNTIFSRKDRELKNQVQSVLKSFAILFSSIKHSTPLVLYNVEIKEKDETEILLQRFIDYLLSQVKSDYQNSPCFKKKECLSILLTFAFYIGLGRMLKEHGVTKKEDGIEIDIIKDTFNNIYRRCGLSLNEVILGNEVSNLKFRLQTDHEWTVLVKNLYDTSNSASPNERNFFAHAGFESNLTESKKEGQKIFLRYRMEQCNLIKDWLINAIT